MLRKLSASLLGGCLTYAPVAALTNGDFEDTPFHTAWQNVGAVITDGFAPGSTQGARFTAGSQSLRQTVSWNADWHLDYWFMIKPTGGRRFSLIIDTGGTNTTINLRYENEGWYAYAAGTWATPLALDTVEASIDQNNDGDLDDAGDTKNVYHMRVTGHGWGSAAASYDLQLSDANGTAFTSSVTGLTRYQGGTPTSSGPTGIKFGTEFGNNPGFWLDDVSSHQNTPEDNAVIDYLVATGNTLSWQTQNATTLTLNPGNIDVTGLTSYTVNPITTQTYTLTAGAASKSFTIGVGETYSPVLINEFLALNPAGEDWIEIHNPNSFSINLSDWALTDNPLNPTKWQFPATAIAPGDYLQLSPFALAGDGEYLALLNADGLIQSEFSPQYPAQFSGVSYGRLANGSHGYFGTPTPAAANQPTPFITNHNTQPQPDGSLLVSALAGSSSATLTGVSLIYRAMYAPEITIPMTHLGGGLHQASIPALAAAPGEMLRWRITAQESGGQTAKLPPFPSATASPEYFGTVIAAPELTSSLPILQWFQNGGGSETRTGTRCSLFWNGEFYDNVLVHLRGATTATLEKKPHQFEFNPGHTFRIAPGSPRVDQINVNAAYPDSSYLRDILPMENLRTMGLPTPDTFPIRVERNGSFHSLGIFIEQPDKQFLQRHDTILDPDGPLFKATGNGSWLISSSGFEARNNATLTDLSTFTASLNSPNQLNFLLENVDLPSVVNYLAVNVVDSIFNPQKNYYIHKNRFGEWMFLPWDRDFSYGHRWLGGGDPRGSAGPTTFLVADERYEWGGSDHDFKGGYNRLFNAIFANPLTSEMFYRRLRSTIDTILAPGLLESRIEELRPLMKPEADLDRATWGFTTDGSYRRFPQESFDLALDRIKTTYLPQRRTFLENNGGTPTRGTLPASHSAAPTITFGQIITNPASGNQDEESIQLLNNNPFAVDVSNWRIEGGITHTLRPGTVIPANSSLYLSPNIIAFRAANAPVFSQGNYNGHLSNFGETLTLLNPANTTIDTTTTPISPNPNQLYLRISEIMYHPVPNADAEFIELLNTSDTVTLNLENVTFTNGITYTFPAITLAPGGRTVVHYADFTSGRLSNSGETIKLDDADGSTIQEFTYHDTAPWPTSPDAGGPSLIFLGGDPNSPENWRASLTPGGNPGTSDSIPFSGGDLLDYALLSEPLLNISNNTFTTIPNPGHDDVNFTPQWSTDLITWHQSGFQLATSEPLTWNIPPSTDSKIFFRFAISLR